MYGGGRLAGGRLAGGWWLLCLLGRGKIESVLFIETSKHIFKALKHVFIC